MPSQHHAPPRLLPTKFPAPLSGPVIPQAAAPFLEAYLPTAAPKETGLSFISRDCWSVFGLWWSLLSPPLMS